MSGSVLAAIVVCTLIAVLVAGAAVVVVLLLMRRRRQKKAAEAAQPAIVGPATKPSQPTHNGTWSGSFHGLWKNHMWRGEDDELPLSDRPDGVRYLLSRSRCCNKKSGPKPLQNYRF